MKAKQAPFKLTDRSIAKCAAPKTKEPTTYWDSELKGFGLLVTFRNKRKRIAARDIRRDGKRVAQRRIQDRNLPADGCGGGAASSVEAPPRYGGWNRYPKASARAARASRNGTGYHVKHKMDIGKLKTSTVHLYDYQMTHLAEFADRPLGAITAEDLVEQFKRIKKRINANGTRLGDGATTAKNTIKLFKSIYKHAIPRSEPPLPPLPDHLLELPAPKKVRETILPEKKMSLWYDTLRMCRNAEHRDYIVLVLLTGMRRREATKLQWSEIDWEEQEIHLPASRTKTGRKKTVPITRGLVHDILEARRPMIDQGFRFVFPSVRSASGHIEEPRWILGWVAKRCGVYVSVHALRHTCATMAEIESTFR